MKNLLLVVFIFSITTWCIAQKAPEGNRVSLEKETHKLYMLELPVGDSTGFYTLNILYKFGAISSKYGLIKYNNELEIAIKSPLPKKYNSKKIEYIQLFMIKDQLYVLFLSSYRSKSMIYYFAQKINKESLTPMGEPIQIGEASYIISPFADYEPLIIEFSSDSSHILVCSKTSDNTSRNAAFNVSVFDNSFNEIWKRSITLPYKSNLFKLESVAISNEGAIFLNGKLYKSIINQDMPRGEPNFTYQIISLHRENKKHSNISLLQSDNYLTQIRIAVNEANELLIVGLYSPTGVEYSKGVFVQRMNASTGELISSGFKPFPKEIITKYSLPRYQKKAKDEDAKPELKYLKLDILLTNSDGAFRMVGEIRFTYETTLNNRMSTIYNSNYDIFVIDFTSHDEMASIIPIKRQQYGASGGVYHSYIIAQTSSSLHFIFNDHIDNYIDEYIEYNNVFSMFGKKDFKEKGCIAEAIVDNDGNLTRNLIYPIKDLGLFMNKINSAQISGNKVIIQMQWGFTRKFLRLNLISTDD